MSRAGIVPPPPWSTPTDLETTDTEEYAYHFVTFNGKYRTSEERAQLMAGLNKLPETLMVLEMSYGEGDIHAMFRVGRGTEADRRLSEWIDIMAGQRLYNRVRTGWVRAGAEMIRFAK